MTTIIANGGVEAATGPVSVRSRPAARPALRPVPSTNPDDETRRFIDAQAQDAREVARRLGPFRPGEFGAGPASPSAAHIKAANGFLSGLQRGLIQVTRQLDATAGDSQDEPSSDNLSRLLRAKERALDAGKAMERIWDFYFRLFGQRQTRFGDWLLGADRIALDCYQAIYTGLDTPRSVPTPPPFSFMETGGSPSTFRRGVTLTRLGRRKNPFPIIHLPYHRLVNPWTLGAIHHEVSHNIQNDLGLWEVVPRRIAPRLLAAGLPPDVARTWARWHKEIWADLCGLLLGGPALITSLMGVVARGPRATLGFNSAGVHPTPYLRVLINLELLRRLGFTAEADAFDRLWRRLYPRPDAGNIPPAMLATFPRANRLVVDTICFQPYAQLGGKRLADVVRFRPAHQAMVAEAAGRIAHGVDPGILPSRFLVGAARWALARRLATPEKITADFYKALGAR
jgi:hypothetical protein